ncbi:MAG: dihydroxyacetone kinase subunit L [Methylococcales bacterium]|nr:MAG: dihydroxyacetone kinase subunit L [Methylococcales bacterium]
MTLTPTLLPKLIAAISETLASHADEITELDQAIGDGDHLINLQRGIKALTEKQHELTALDWPSAWQKIGMILMSAIGGASGSLYATLFLALSKAAKDQALNVQRFADSFNLAVEAVKHRGKAEAGEKTLLDVYIPVALYLNTAATSSIPLPEILNTVVTIAITGMEATRDMIATKGRASFLEQRSIGHIDAGAKTAQLMISAIVGVLIEELSASV